MNWSIVRLLVGSVLFGFALQACVYAGFISQLCAFGITLPAGILLGYLEVHGFRD